MFQILVRYTAYSLVLSVISIGVWGISRAFAQVMQSTNYQIQSDSVNIGGGYSSSTNYREESTVGEVSTGFSSSSNYMVSAGYQQGGQYIALSSVGDVVMSPTIGGVTGGTSDGSTSMTVTTDNYAGYTLTISASTSPAMQSSTANIPDYTPAGASPDFSFSNGAAESQFGFSPEGSDIAQRYQDSGGVCNVSGSDTALACWDGLSTTPRTIASRVSANHPLGTDTTIRFRVSIGPNAAQEEGLYTATTTVTAVPN